MSKKIALVLTAEGKKAKIAFKGKHVPLGERSQADLLHLAIMAREARRDDYIAHFQELPSLADLKEAQTESELQDIADNGPKGPAAPTPASALTGPRSVNLPAAEQDAADKANAKAAEALEAEQAEQGNKATKATKPAANNGGAQS